MLLFMNLIVTTNQKPIIDTHTRKGNVSKHNTKDSHQITSKESKRRRKEQKRIMKKTPKINKMAISKYISIIALNINGLNPPITYSG